MTSSPAPQHPVSATPAPHALAVALAHVRGESRAGRHREALAAALALQPGAPDGRDVLYLIAANQRCLGLIEPALATLARLEQHHPGYSLLHQERGHCHVARRERAAAVEAFTHAVRCNPALLASWRMLERLHRQHGDGAAAAAAAAQVATLEALPAELVRAGGLYSDGELGGAEAVLRAFLLMDGKHFEARHLLARVLRQRRALAESERLFEALLAEAPQHAGVRADHARVLIDRQDFAAALTTLGPLLAIHPADRDALNLKAIASAGSGDHATAIALHRALLALDPGQAQRHLSLAQSQQALGDASGAIASCHAALALRPGFGDAWWSLANLKTYRFTADEIARMRADEAAAHARPGERLALCFALGKALEDAGDHAASWECYRQGNALKRAEQPDALDALEAAMRRQIASCTPALFAAHAGGGDPDPAPIFIVGLPRSGSTLIEQILASHSCVAASRELPDLPRIALELEGPRDDARQPRYPAVLAELDAAQLRGLGRRYLDATRAWRQGRPLFIDKMPNNFRDIGLIHLMLPNARIIDVRREPMACCFSNLKQLFAAGQPFCYGIEDIARYYRAYLDLMRHWDRVLPGRVLRVHYEDMVEALEPGVRRILAHCDLDFEPACLDFHRTARAIATPSSEQVRQPIYRSALEQWRHYEPWLAPLREALGEALTGWRD
ncbi:MAG: sulfotransferase [Pseudomonadota bacterium]|nr:sulfotransferase [Pseudomonadota bacterium]